MNFRRELMRQILPNTILGRMNPGGKLQHEAVFHLVRMCRQGNAMDKTERGREKKIQFHGRDVALQAGLRRTVDNFGFQSITVCIHAFSFRRSGVRNPDIFPYLTILDRQVSKTSRAFDNLR